MKAYYTTSTAFKLSENGAEIFSKTLNYLGFKLGQKNVSEFHDTPIKNGSPVDMDNVLKLVKRNEKSIRECDVFVADITEGSSGLGFEIGMALNEKKQLLILRQKNEKKITGYSSISSPAHKNITYVEYDNMEDVTKVVDKFIEIAKNKIDTKFILIIPTEIDKYLSWAGDFYRMHKAQVVRKAVEATMAKDKDWKAYQKETVN